jgi:hypothetical protein
MLCNVISPLVLQSGSSPRTGALDPWSVTGNSPSIGIPCWGSVPEWSIQLQVWQVPVMFFWCHKMLSAISHHTVDSKCCALRLKIHRMCINYILIIRVWFIIWSLQMPTYCKRNDRAFWHLLWQCWHGLVLKLWSSQVGQFFHLLRQQLRMS